jgi:modulator of FtsH protease
MGSLILLVNILIISSLCLIPAQPVPFLGLEILVLGAGAWTVLSRKDMANYKGLDPVYKSKYIKILVFTQAAILPYLIAGILLLNNREAGLYFLIPGVTFSFFKSLADAWVLLVEINR